MSIPPNQPTPETWVPKIRWGDRIRIVRRGLGMNQDQFAELLGVGKQRLAAWESGANRPSDAVEMAQLIQAKTGVPATWMLGLGTTPVSGNSHACARPAMRTSASLIVRHADQLDRSTQ